MKSITRLLALLAATATIMLSFTPAFGSESAPTDGEETPMPEDTIEENPHILTLNSLNFNEYINKNELVLVEFFSSDCKYCHQFEDNVYKHVGAHYADIKGADGASPAVVVARINGPTVPEILDTIGVTGFPALVLFKNADPMMYNGIRSSEKLIQFIDRIRTVPVVTFLDSRDELDAFRARNPGPLVALCTTGMTPAEEQDDAGLVDEYAGTELKNRFFGLAKRMLATKDDLYFAYVSDPSLIGATECPAMAMLHPDYADPIVYDLGTDAEAEADERDYYAKGRRVVPKRTPLAMGNWIMMKSLPLIDEINAFNYGRYANSDKPIGWLILREFDESSFNKEVVLKWYKNIASEFNNMLFVYLNQ